MGRVAHLQLPRNVAKAFPGVVEAAASEFGFRPAELTAGGRLNNSLSHARAVALWCCFQTGDVSYEALADMFGMGYTSCRARVLQIALRRSKQPAFRARLNRVLAAVPAAAQGSK